MAASRVLARLSVRSPSLAFKTLNNKSNSPAVSPLKLVSQSQVSESTKRISRISRLPLALSSLGSMMPLHSAIATARLTSILAVESQSWGLIPQGVAIVVIARFATGIMVLSVDDLPWRRS